LACSLHDSLDQAFLGSVASPPTDDVSPVSAVVAVPAYTIGSLAVLWILERMAVIL